MFVRLVSAFAEVMAGKAYETVLDVLKRAAPDPVRKRPSHFSVQMIQSNSQDGHTVVLICDGKVLATASVKKVEDAKPLMVRWAKEFNIPISRAYDLLMKIGTITGRLTP